MRSELGSSAGKSTGLVWIVQLLLIGCIGVFLPAVSRWGLAGVQPWGRPE